MPPDTLTIRQGQFAVLYDPGLVWRIGYRPDPWTWTPRQYAHDGRIERHLCPYGTNTLA